MPRTPTTADVFKAIAGLGLSLSAAAYLRWELMMLCVASLQVLIVNRLDRLKIIFSYFKKENEPCNIE
jgi:hypothetical protein